MGSIPSTNRCTSSGSRVSSRPVARAKSQVWIRMSPVQMRSMVCSNVEHPMRVSRSAPAMRAVDGGTGLPVRDGGMVPSILGMTGALAEQGEAVGVTLELWSDPENDGERSCCSASAASLAALRTPWVLSSVARLMWRP